MLYAHDPRKTGAETADQGGMAMKRPLIVTSTLAHNIIIMYAYCSQTSFPSPIIS